MSLVPSLRFSTRTGRRCLCGVVFSKGAGILLIGCTNPKSVSLVPSLRFSTRTGSLIG